MSPRTPEQFKSLRKERRQEILDAALEVFAEKGYHSASVSQVAERAGVSKGLMYNYFSGKQDVLLNILTEMFDEFSAELHIEEEKQFTREEVVSMVRKTIEITKRNPNRWKLYVGLSLQPNVLPLLTAEMMPKIQPYLVSMHRFFVSQGQKDPMVAMRFFNAALDGIAFQYILDPENFPFDETIEFFLQLILPEKP